MSDRPEDRPVPNLARASARNARTQTAGRTDGTSTRRGIPARQPMSDQERAAIRQAGAEDARRSRIANGLPERIEDSEAVATLAAILCRPPSMRPAKRSAAHVSEAVPRLHGRCCSCGCRPDFYHRFGIGAVVTL